MSKKVYILEHLGCANCAAKIEKKIIELPGVEEAIITFSTKQLRLTAEDPDSYIEEIQKIARSYEPNITITERKRRGNAAATMKHPTHAEHSESCDCHEHGEHCGCHEHEHQHEHVEHCDCHSHEHQHKHDEHCGCHSHEHQHEHSGQGEHEHQHGEERSELITLAIGITLFVIGQLLPDNSIPSIVVFIAAYLVLGGTIIKDAISNLTHGQLFDENFLMSIATIGAFAIQEYAEAVGVMLFFRIGEFFEHKAVERSRNSIMEAIDMRPETVNLVHGNETKIIAAEDAQPGDILLVRAGDRIPLDGIIVDGHTRIDTSAVTGEPVPVSASVGDSIISGCINISGTIQMKVEKPLNESMVTRILDSVETAAANKPQMERFITRFSRIYTPFVVGAAVLTAIVPSLVTGDWNYWFYTAITFLVISCPCALVLSVPLAFFSGIGAGSSKGILFKGGLSLEAIEKVNAIVMDKTGTITKGTFEVKEILPLSDTTTQEEIISLCASCEASSSHPIAGSILSYVKEHRISYEKAAFIEELAGKGIHAVIDENNILCGNMKLMKEYQITCDHVVPSSYGTQVYLAKNGTLLGTILIEDEIKSDSKEAIAKLKKMGLKTIMLTGDDEANAAAIAEGTGIDQYYARLLPEDKLSVLQDIRKEHGAVMFIGDGINDAPVLAGADVGAAMGNGADAAIEAADIVFMNQDLSSIHQSIEISKASTKVAKQNIVFALFIKLCVIILGFFGIANMWFAVFADSGVAMMCVMNSIRVLYQHRKK